MSNPLPCVPKEIVNLVGFSSGAQIYELPQSGSNRKFYRVRDHKKSVVLIQSEQDDPDFAKYIEIAKFLREFGVGVPEIYASDEKKKLVLEEDLGDLSLQKYVTSCRGEVTLPLQILITYKKVIDALLLMQIMGGKKIAQCPALMDRVFDYNTFRWETQYFTDYFLKMYCRLVGAQYIEPLQKEFHQLAMRLVNEPLYFMHRDFQSQNILLKDGKIKVVDFQGARRGLLAYDLASLLKDAYVEIDDELREKLIDYYLNSLSKDWKIEINPNEFRQVFLYAGLQRNMQALGAFAFLTLIKHKPNFEQYIPRAVAYLYEALTKTDELPELTKIIKKVKKNLTTPKSMLEYHKRR